MESSTGKEKQVSNEFFIPLLSARNTYIFAERDDVTVGEAGWEPGKGRVKRGADGDGSAVPEKRRALVTINQSILLANFADLVVLLLPGKPTLTGVVHVRLTCSWDMTNLEDSQAYSFFDL